MPTIIDAPVPITPGVAAQVIPPTTFGVGDLILDNLSTYLLAVTVGPDTFYQSPLVEAKYQVGNAQGQPVQINPIALPGDTSTAGVVAPTWWDAAPPGQWPIALAGAAEVAAATAAALLASGVPNVLLQSFVGSTFGADFDVSTFSQITVSFKCLKFGVSVTDALASLTWTQGATTKLVTYTDTLSIPSPTAVNVGLASGVQAWSIPTLAQTLNVGLPNPALAPVNMAIWGSNRVVPGIAMLGEAFMPRAFFFPNAAVAAGAPVGLPAGDAGAYFTNFNGTVSIDVQSSLAGQIGYRYINQAGNGGNIVVGNVAAGTRTMLTAIHPKVPVIWVFIPTAAGNAQITAQIASSTP